MDSENKLIKKLPFWEDCELKEKVFLICIKLLIFLPVCGALAVCLSFYCIYLAFYIGPLLTDLHPIPKVFDWPTDQEKKTGRVKGIILGTCMTYFLLNFLASFARASLTVPGHVPPTAKWQLSLDPEQKVFIKNQNISLRSCRYCQVKKPDRCHHCRQCETCVLKMDHHCNWIGNCVGVRNYKYFFLVVFYGLLSSVLFVGSFWETLVVVLLDMDYSLGLAVFLLSSYFFCCLVAVALLAFFIFHLCLISKNLTSLEYFERRGLKSSCYPYSVSVYNNFKDALGIYPVFWLVPIGPYRTEEDGLYLPNN